MYMLTICSNVEHFLIPQTKINSKWIKDLNKRPETIKLLEANIGKTHSDLNHSRILYDPRPRVMEINEQDQIIQQNSTSKEQGQIKFKSFCTAKESISKVKRQPSEWEEVRPNKAADKDIITNI